MRDRPTNIIYMLKQTLWAKILMAQWWLWRSEKDVSMNVLFLWDITEIMATIPLIGCTDNECNPWSPWKQAARKQGEEHSWSQLNNSSAHEPARQALLGQCFGTVNSQDFLPFTLKTFRVAKLPASAHQLLLPRSHWPRRLQGRLYQWVSCYPRALGFPRERFRVENSLSPLFLPLGLRQPCKTIHTVSASRGPSQPFLYLRKDWEIWCTTVSLHSFSWMKRECL